MKDTFCKECGEGIAPNLDFCTACGTPVTKTVHSSKPKPIQSESKVPMSKKNKLVFGSILAFFILLIGTHFTFVYLTDSTKQLKTIYNAVIDEDGSTLFSQLTVADDVIYDQESYTKGLNNPSFPIFYDELSNAVERVNEAGLTEIIKDEEGIEIFRIKQEKVLFFYSKASIEPVDQKLVVNTDLENTSLTIAGETFNLEGKPLSINKVLPDHYTVELKGENTYFDSEGTTIIERSIFSESPELDLFASDYSIQFAGSPEDSIIYINDVSTKKTIKELNSIEPIFGNEATFHSLREYGDDKTEKSEIETAEPGETITFAFPKLVKKAAEEKEKEEQTEMDASLIHFASFDYSDFRYAYESALNYRDFNYIESYLYSSGEAYGELKEFISDIDSTYYDYNFLSNEVTDGSVKGDKVHLHVTEIFTFENHLGQVTDYNREKEYIMIEVSPELFEIEKINIKDTDRSKQ